MILDVIHTMIHTKCIRRCPIMVRAALERKGTPIRPLDMLIAGHAKSEGLILVTNNTREFKRVDGLAVEDWV
jgi:predicted nucleic acid-binding protein